MREPCTIPGCESKRVGRGWCTKHWRRWREQGDPLYIPLRQRGHGHSVRGHQSRTYQVWASMKDRCANSNNKKYHLYGGRGIKVCDRWQLFENFLSDMGERPGPEYSLDRYPNNDGNYEPGNCRWATIEQQNNNTRKTLRIEFRGEIKSAAQWSRTLSISEKVIRRRHRRGVPIDLDMRTIRFVRKVREQNL
jgi:hypothetical protein